MVLAPLAAVAIALAALLLILAAGYFAKFIGHLIPDLPVIGSQLRDAVESLADAAVNALTSFLDSAVAPVARALAYPVIMAIRLYDGIITTLTSLANTTSWIVNTWVHRIIHVIQAWVRDELAALRAALTAAIDAVRAYAHHLYDLAISYVDSRINWLRALLTAAIAAAVSTLRREIAAALATAEGLITQLRHYTDSLVARVVATLTAAINTVDKFAHDAYADTLGRIATMTRQLEADIAIAEHDAITTAIGTVETAVTVGIGDVWGDVVAGIDGAIDAAGDGFDWVREELRKIDLTKVTDLAGLAALTGISTAVLTRYLRDCGMPNCRNLSGFGRELQELLGLVEGVALFDLLREMITDPHGAAHELQSVLSPLADGVIGDARSLFGVA